MCKVNKYKVYTQVVKYKKSRLRRVVFTRLHKICLLHDILHKTCVTCRRRSRYRWSKSL